MVQQRLNNGTITSDSTGLDWLSLSFKKEKKEKRESAITYFRLLSAYNDIKISEAEIKLLAHISMYKGIVTGPCKTSFIESNNSSMASVDNLISKLKKKKLVIKEDNTIMIRPVINLDFVNNDNFIFSFKCFTKRQ